MEDTKLENQMGNTEYPDGFENWSLEDISEFHKNKNYPPNPVAEVGNTPIIDVEDGSGKIVNEEVTEKEGLEKIDQKTQEAFGELIEEMESKGVLVEIAIDKEKDSHLIKSQKSTRITLGLKNFYRNEEAKIRDWIKLKNNIETVASFFKSLSSEEIRNLGIAKIVFDNFYDLTRFENTPIGDVDHNLYIGIDPITEESLKHVVFDRSNIRKIVLPKKEEPKEEGEELGRHENPKDHEQISESNFELMYGVSVDLANYDQSKSTEEYDLKSEIDGALSDLEDEERQVLINNNFCIVVSSVLVPTYYEDQKKLEVGFGCEGNEIIDSIRKNVIPALTSNSEISETGSVNDGAQKSEIDPTVPPPLSQPELPTVITPEPETNEAGSGGGEINGIETEGFNGASKKGGSEDLQVEDENVPEWKKTENWKSFEEARRKFAEVKQKLDFSRTIEGQLTISQEDYKKFEQDIDAVAGDYKKIRENVVKDIKDGVCKELGFDPSNSTEEQKKEFDSKSKVLIFELIEDEYKERRRVLKEIKSQNRTKFGKMVDSVKGFTLEKAKGLLSNKVIKSYSDLSKEQRMALNFAIGSSVGLIAGAATSIGVTSYLGWRAARVIASGTASGFAGEWANKKWSIEYLNKAEEKELEDLKNDPDLDVDAKAFGVKEIRERYKKERLYAKLGKVGAGVVAGVATGALVGLAESWSHGLDGANRVDTERNIRNLVENKRKVNTVNRLPSRIGFDPNEREDLLPKIKLHKEETNLNIENKKIDISKTVEENIRGDQNVGITEKVNIDENIFGNKNIDLAKVVEDNRLDSSKISTGLEQEGVTEKTGAGEIFEDGKIDLARVVESNKLDNPELATKIDVFEPQSEKIFSDPSVLNHKVASGDSVWSILKDVLEHNDKFKVLTEAQKTFVLSTYTNEVLKKPGEYGLSDDGTLYVGDNVKLGNLFVDQKGFNTSLAKALEIKPNSSQEANILTNNQNITDWVKENPDKQLSPDQIDDILRPKSLNDSIPEIPKVSSQDLKELEKYPTPNVSPLPKSITESQIDSNRDDLLFNESQMAPTEEDISKELSAGDDKVGGLHSSDDTESVVPDETNIEQPKNPTDFKDQSRVESAADNEYKTGFERLLDNAHDMEKSDAEQEMLKSEIEDYKQRLATLESQNQSAQTVGANKFIRSPLSDSKNAEFLNSIEVGKNNFVNSIYGESRFLGLSKIIGVDTLDWKFIKNLDVNKVLNYFNDPNSSDLPENVRQILNNSDKHAVLVKELSKVAGDIKENFKVDFKPYSNGESVEDYIKRAGSFLIKQSNLNRT